MNKVYLVGRITKDFEIRFTPNGVPTANFSVAVQKRGKIEEGKPSADFINVVTWNKVAENCSNYLGKGSLIAVSGKLATRNYVTQNGDKRFVVEVIADEVNFLDKKNSNNEDPSFGPSIDDEDMPF